MAQNRNRNYLRYLKSTMTSVEGKDERRQRGEFKEECYWSGHLVRSRTDHVSTPAWTYVVHGVTLNKI